jgi:mannan endo-1,4-beta-mannosidase
MNWIKSDILINSMLLSILFFYFGCEKSNLNDIQVVKTNDILVDSLATQETVALYTNLQALANNKFLFGHQETLAYGVGWVNDGTGNQSDVKAVCGDFPAVYGWDIGDIHLEHNVDSVPFSEIKSLIKIAYNKGGINTISIHQDNPITGENAWDNTPAVDKILPNGSHHTEYTKRLDLIADFLLDLKTDDGIYIPIIFRPYHEHNQTWPWWGKEACNESEFIDLWKMTIKYLRDVRGIHHLIYAISPQDVKTASSYFERYPGDDYVDVLGYDYWRWSLDSDYVSFLGEALDMLGKEAQKRGKIAALTEAGFDTLPIDDWWTNYLLKALEYSDASENIAWALVWRNARKSHFHAPFPGQQSAANFIDFYKHPKTVFEKDLPDMYQ